MKMAEPEDKVQTFVKGFDELIEGGIPTGSIVLMSGLAGTMKSSLAYYILYKNALLKGKKCLYITLEQNESSLLMQMTQMGMPHAKVADKLLVVDVSSLRLEEKKPIEESWLGLTMKTIQKIKERIGCDIMVLDSLDAYTLLAESEFSRKAMFMFFEWLRKMGMTCFLVSEAVDSMPLMALQGGDIVKDRAYEAFLADGVLHLKLVPVGEVEVRRRIRCIKMRETDHDMSYMDLTFKDGEFMVTKALPTE
jgi:KaiC/GvpD/RAD55 family RecA-like ATPase